MQIAGMLLLAFCALFSTLCVANARSIMATNEQDDYEAALQDLYNTMALKQEDNKGNKVAKAQFSSFAASILAPIAFDLISNAISQHEKVAVLQEDTDYEAVLQDLYNSIALEQEGDEEDDDGDQQAKAQFLGALFKVFTRAIPKVIKPILKGVGKSVGKAGLKGLKKVGKKIAEEGTGILAEELLDSAINGQYEYSQAELQDLHDTLAVTQDDADDDKARMQRRRFSFGRHRRRPKSNLGKRKRRRRRPGSKTEFGKEILGEAVGGAVDALVGGAIDHALNSQGGGSPAEGGGNSNEYY